jgi:hypothetical protein
MLTRKLAPTSPTITAQCVHVIGLNYVRRSASYQGHEVAHHDPYQARYERLWKQKATLDWLPKAEGNWQESHGKKQAYYNRILAVGVITFALSLVYLRTVIIARSGALTKPPYHLVGNDAFPGSKYTDTTEVKR